MLVRGVGEGGVAGSFGVGGVGRVRVGVGGVVVMVGVVLSGVEQVLGPVCEGVEESIQHIHHMLIPARQDHTSVHMYRYSETTVCSYHL